MMVANARGAWALACGRLTKGSQQKVRSSWLTSTQKKADPEARLFLTMNDRLHLQFAANHSSES